MVKFQISSSPIPFGQLKFFMCSFLGRGDESLCTVKGSGDTTKVVVTPIYGENILQDQKIFKMGIQHTGLNLYKVYLKDDIGLTLT